MGEDSSYGPESKIALYCYGVAAIVGIKNGTVGHQLKKD